MTSRRSSKSVGFRTWLRMSKLIWQDKTVVYNARFEKGTLVLSRPSVVMNCEFLDFPWDGIRMEKGSDNTLVDTCHFSAAKTDGAHYRNDLRGIHWHGDEIGNS